MHAVYHRSITMQALGGTLSASSLERVIRGNLGLDSLRGQIGHDEYHFDANAFVESRAFIEKNRRLIRPAAEGGDIHAAQRAFGRLTHTAQDFFAHSNYVGLWLARFPAGNWPVPEEIDPFDRVLLDSPDLRSGKLYYPLEVFSFIPLLKKYVLPRLPRDSHAWMNLDGPEQGPKFPYAMAAAVKCTRAEFERTVLGWPKELVRLFCN